MKFDAFFGGSYESQALTADCARTINMYPEALQDPGATAKRAMYPTPGVDALGAASTGVGRGLKPPAGPLVTGKHRR